MPDGDEKKKSQVSEWILAGFFVALGGFLFEAARWGFKQIAAKRAADDDDEEEGLL